MTRCRLAAAAIACLVGTGAVVGQSASDAAPASAAIPSVNMEAVVKAAQIDPRRADDTLTPGAKASVLVVEQALQARHLLDPRWVDGYFGTETVKSYTNYQLSLGFRGIAANGIPGPSSLTSLNRFCPNSVANSRPRSSNASPCTLRCPRL